MTVDDCIWLDPFGVSGLVVSMPNGGVWVSDYDLLHANWEHGWDMRALNYCIDDMYEGGRFRSIQVVLGHEDVEGDPDIEL